MLQRMHAGWAHCVTGAHVACKWHQPMAPVVQAPYKGLLGFLTDLRSLLPLPRDSQRLRIPAQACPLLH